MAELIAVVGDTGQGKTHSVQYLDPEETVIINMAGKGLSFRGWKRDYKPMKLSPKKAEIAEGNFLQYTQNPSKAWFAVKTLIKAADKDDDIKHVVIDDFQYLLSFEYLSRASENGWSKFTDIGEKTYKVMKAANEAKDVDLNIFFLTHDETVEQDYTKKRKMKTIGR